MHSYEFYYIFHITLFTKHLWNTTQKMQKLRFGHIYWKIP